MKLMLHEIRLLLSGLVLGLVFMPTLLWYIYFKFDIQLIVYKAYSIDSFYQDIYTGLNEPLVWLCLLLPYLLMRLALLLLPSKTPRPQAATPLTQAVVKGHEDMVRRLLKEGSDINGANKNAQTPLHLAADDGNSSVVRILLEHGAIVDPIETAAGYTPLHYAAARGHAEACEILIRFGADHDALTRNQDSPLHLAIEQGRAGVVAVLLKYRARLDTKNKNDMTPLQLAEHLNNKEIANLINQHLSESWPYLQISRC
jgi:ankyrin repeat protein